MMQKILRSVDCICLVALASILVIEGLRLMMMHTELGLRPEKIGPGTYMAIIGVMLAVFATLELIKRGHATTDTGKYAGINTLKTFFLLVICVALMPFSGFTLSVGLFLAIYMTWVARQRLIGAFLFTAAVMTAYYLIFLKLAKIVLPRGIVGF